MRKITSVAIHCSATRPSMDIGAAEIAQWHKKQGWATIGYHYVIRRSGLVEKGRPDEMPGAHVAGHNANSIGICLVGGVNQDDFRKAEDNFTPAQMKSLATLCKSLSAAYPGAVFKGHRDYPGVKKACPSFNAKAWAKANGLPA